MNDDLDDALDWAPKYTAQFDYAQYQEMLRERTAVPAAILGIDPGTPVNVDIETGESRAWDEAAWRTLYTNTVNPVDWVRPRLVPPYDSPWRDPPIDAAAVEELQRQLEELKQYQAAREQVQRARRRTAQLVQPKQPEAALPTTPESGPGARKIADQAEEL